MFSPISPENSLAVDKSGIQLFKPYARDCALSHKREVVFQLWWSQKFAGSEPISSL
jgi:hypothetical protein